MSPVIEAIAVRLRFWSAVEFVGSAFASATHDERASLTTARWRSDAGKRIGLAFAVSIRRRALSISGLFAGSLA